MVARRLCHEGKRPAPASQRAVAVRMCPCALHSIGQLLWVQQYEAGRGDFFSKRAVMHWHRMPRGGVESPCLEVFKQPVDVALRDVVLGHGGDGLAV